MAFLPSLSAREMHHYHRTVAQSVQVRNHFEALVWLQGDMQRYLPHDILIAAWGNFDGGAVHYDILSALVGVRSLNSSAKSVTPMLRQLFRRWSGSGHEPFTLRTDDAGFALQPNALKPELGNALREMNCAMVHGISDQRSNHGCLYLLFSSQSHYSQAECDAMALVLPYVDTALRQIKHLPHQTADQPGPAPLDAPDLAPEHDLSNREVEIVNWVGMGKTNPEIGRILGISEFTVKNHLQRVFKKLDVYNRTQAVGKLKAMTLHV